MFMGGLVSVTFRELNPEQIIDLVRKSKLNAIEWGGDVHVPHGDLACADSVRDLTRQAGLTIVSYGSYYRVGHNEPIDFEQVAETAVTLGAPVVRVWAGKQGSDDADDAYWKTVIADSKRIARIAAARKLAVSYEYHAGTLTDTCAGTLRLLNGADEPNLLTHWQPVAGRGLAKNLDELTALLPHLCHLHCFHWVDGQRCPLADGIADWETYLQAAAETQRDHAVLMEFVADNEPDNYLADAGELRQMLSKMQAE